MEKLISGNSKQEGTLAEEWDISDRLITLFTRKQQWNEKHSDWWPLGEATSQAARELTFKDKIELKDIAVFCHPTQDGLPDVVVTDTNFSPLWRDMYPYIYLYGFGSKITNGWGKMSNERKIKKILCFVLANANISREAKKALFTVPEIKQAVLDLIENKECKE